jgi:hypothetical protein
MPDRAKDMGQMKRSPWFSMLGFVRGVNDPTTGKITFAKPWRRPKPTQGCIASKEEEEVVHNRNVPYFFHERNLFISNQCF